MVDPFDFASLKIERDDRIGRRLRRARVAVAGADVNCIPFGIDGRRRPDSGPGRPPRLHAFLVLAARFRFISDHVRLPDGRAGGCVEGRHASTERAAFVLRSSTLPFFAEARRGDIQAALMQCRRAGHPGQAMVVQLSDPQSFAVRRIDRISVRDPIREVHGVTRCSGPTAWPDHQRAAYAGFRAKGPVDAAGLGVESVDHAAVAPHEQPTTSHRRLRTC